MGVARGALGLAPDDPVPSIRTEAGRDMRAARSRRDLLILITPHIIDDLVTPSAGK